jgi:ABC-2 type transport system permease protein
MNKWLLKLVRLFDPVFTRQGVDTVRMYAIVETKLMMDKRRVYLQWKQKQQAENRHHLTAVLASYLFIGFITGISILFIPSLVIALVMVHAYLIFMMAMTLITDFSSVLLDTTDNQVILPRPVSSKTFFMARLVHILIYLLQFTLALSVGPIIFTFAQYGILTGIGLCFTSLLAVLFAVFLTYLLYLLILRFSNEEKVKDIVSYFQVFMTIFFVAGYQVIPRMVNLSSVVANFQVHWYYYLLPPFWMALALEALHDLNFNSIHLLMIFLSVTAPLFFFWLLTRFLAPSFARKLEAMHSGTAAAGISVAKNTGNQSLSATLARICCSSRVENAAFELTWKMTGREKSFRLQFYPSLAYIAVFIFIFVFKSGRSVSETWNGLPASNSFLWCIYLPMFTISSSIMIAAYYENYQAAWIYHSLPVAKPGHLITGSIKSLFIKFFIPVYLILFCFCLYIWGWKVSNDFLFGLLNNGVCFLLFAALSNHYLPFSRQPNTQQQTGKILNAFIQMMVVGVFVGMHYLLVNKPLVLYIIMPALAIACWLLIRKIQGIAWQKITI